MRTIAALIAGLLLSAMTFIAGLAVALTVLNGDEVSHPPGSQETASLWTDEPVRVEKETQNFERLPARHIPKEQVAMLHKAGAGEKVRPVEKIRPAALQNAEPVAEDQLVDPITTGAIDPEAPAQNAGHKTEVAAHVEWCSRRYRSYQPENNSYRPYGGGRRPCVSPYSNVAENADVVENEPSVDVADDREAVAAVSDDQPILDQTEPAMEAATLENADISVDEDHVRSCFARYRSYQPEDNTYQPLDGGPRRQCR